MNDKLEVTTSIFNQKEVFPNCTVEVLRNSITGEESWGWYNNEHPPVRIEVTKDADD